MDIKDLGLSKKELQNRIIERVADRIMHETPDEVKRALLAELEKGHAVIPMGKCDNFDFKTGCRGHEVPEPQGDSLERN